MLHQRFELVENDVRHRDNLSLILVIVNERFDERQRSLEDGHDFVSFRRVDGSGRHCLSCCRWDSGCLLVALAGIGRRCRVAFTHLLLHLRAPGYRWHCSQPTAVSLLPACMCAAVG